MLVGDIFKKISVKGVYYLAMIILFKRSKVKQNGCKWSENKTPT